MKSYLAISLLLLSTACATFDPTVPVYDKLHGTDLGPDVSPDYRQGFNDGCYSGRAVFGNHFYKSFYGFKRDADKVGNYDYETSWYDGYNYCRQSINTLINDGVL
jgi:hypothetical protein